MGVCVFVYVCICCVRESNDEKGHKSCACAWGSLKHTDIPKNGQSQAGLSDGIAGVFIQQFHFHITELPEEEGLGDAPEEEGEDEACV